MPSQPPLLQDWLHHRPASGLGQGARGGQQPEAAEREPGSGHAAGGGAECGDTVCHLGKAEGREQLVAMVKGLGALRGVLTSWGAALGQPPGRERPGGQRAGMGQESCEFPWSPVSIHTCECSQLPPVDFPAIAPGSTG
ncbi:hypothetical protein MC885_000525 [Smutsia gigantea]|nr:hypothetical protein MC885_000525 [Smutsia gigantea]